MGAQCSRTALCQGTPRFRSAQQNVFINVSPTADMCARAPSVGCTISKFSFQEPLASQRVRAGRAPPHCKKSRDVQKKHLHLLK